MMNGIAIILVAWALNGPSSSRTRPASSTSTSGRTLPEQRDGSRTSGTSSASASDVPLNLLLPIGHRLLGARVVLAQADPSGVRGARRGLVAGLGPRGRDLRSASVQIKMFLISGALAGLGGDAADPGSTNNYFPLNYEAELGFTGIAVAFLGQNNPFGILAAAIMWAVLARGEDAILIETTCPVEIDHHPAGDLDPDGRGRVPGRASGASRVAGSRLAAVQARTSRTRTRRPPDVHQPRQRVRDRVRVLHDHLPHRPGRSVQRDVRAS